MKIIEGVGQQEEEAAEELKGFVAQEMLRGFLDFRRLCSFFEAQDQMQNSTRKLQQPFRLQSSSCRVIYDEERKKKSYYQDIIGSFFSGGWTELNPQGTRSYAINVRHE